MAEVRPWDERLAMTAECITVHIFAPRHNAGQLMYYVGCEARAIAINSIPQPCNSLEDAVESAKRVATDNGIDLVLVDDNRE